jgi:hypothetical protein
MSTESVLVQDPAASALTGDDRVCPGCLRALDQPLPAWSRRTDHLWWPIARTLVALLISAAFVVRAERAYQDALWRWTQLQDTLQVETAEVVNRAALARQARLEVLHETEATDGGEATLAAIVAAIAMLGAVGAASAVVRRVLQDRADDPGCSLCAPPRRSSVFSRVGRAWREVERYLVGLCHLLLAACAWILVSQLLAGSPLSWSLVDASTTQILATLESIVHLGQEIRDLASLCPSVA